MRNFLMLLSALSLSFCSHAPKNSRLGNEWVPISTKAQKRLLKKNTQHHREYDGAYLVFQTYVTFLNSEIQINNLKIKSQYSNWDPTTADSERSKLQTKMAGQTDIFLLFYAPAKMYNKLNLESSSWKIILKTNHINLEGKVKLQENISDHIDTYYPFKDPWSRPYLVSFPISTHELEKEPFIIEVVGPKGMAQFKF